MSTPDQIRAEIDETREELRDDLSALQAKVDPSQRAADVVEQLSASTRERPWPTAAAAFASGWASAWLVSKL